MDRDGHFQSRVADEGGSDPALSSSGELPTSTSDWLSSHWRTKSAVRIKQITDIGFAVGDRILDIGCGTGDIAAVVAALIGQSGYLVCIEPNSELFDIASQRLAGYRDRTELRQVNMQDFASDFTGDRFDAALLLNVVGYFDVPTVPIELALQAVRPGGRLIIKTNDFRLSILDPIDFSMYSTLLVAASRGRHNYDYDNYLGASLPTKIAAAAELSGVRRIEVRPSGCAFTAPFTDDESRYILGNLRALVSDGALFMSGAVLDYWRAAIDPSSPSYLMNTPAMTFIMNEIVIILHV